MTNSPTAPLDPVRLQEGDPAPNFQLYDDQGNTVSLGDFSGQRVVLYFYPRALTPGCTTQACDFQAALPLLDDAEIKVIGISPDKPEKLAQFRKTHHLTFPLSLLYDHISLIIITATVSTYYIPTEYNVYFIYI